MNYFIWWLSQNEYEEILDKRLDAQLGKAYILEQFTSRVGRPGRGRLWVHESIPIRGIEWDNSKPAGELAGVRGGIVIHADDAKFVLTKPGVLTDLKLNFITTSIDRKEAIPPCLTCGTEYAGHSAEKCLARVVAQRDNAIRELARVMWHAEHDAEIGRRLRHILKRG